MTLQPSDRPLWSSLFGCLLLGLFALSGCKAKPTPSAGSASSAESKPAPADEQVTLNGAGATFPYPLYSKWISEYGKSHPKVKINYQSIGSGGGIRQLMARTVDFGASDAPMTADEVQKAPAKVAHIPMTMGGVVLAYNLEGLDKPLVLSSDLVVDAYLGKVHKWNDPRIAKLNPGAKLPAKDIAVVYRSDGSGTTAVFTDYLAAVSPEWKDKVGQGKSVRFPKGLGAKGNEGVTGQIKTTPGALGYIELAYATQSNTPAAELVNKAGKPVKASIAGITAAAQGAPLPDTLFGSIVNPDGDESYPISAYTYILVYEDMDDVSKGQTLAEYLWWAVHDGQKLSQALDYAPLPSPVVAKVEARLKGLRAGGKPVLGGS
jgi:phosphate transport system substrate-binding protein